MKHCSFKVAKAIKEAGYPQDYKNEDIYTNPNGGIWVKPTYLETWLWLWREKGIFIKVHVIHKEFNYQILEYQEDGWVSYGVLSHIGYADQEEAIIAAIEYLVDNNLIK